MLRLRIDCKRLVTHLFATDWAGLQMYINLAVPLLLASLSCLPCFISFSGVKHSPVFQNITIVEVRSRSVQWFISCWYTTFTLDIRQNFQESTCMMKWRPFSTHTLRFWIEGVRPHLSVDHLGYPRDIIHVTCP